MESQNNLDTTGSLQTNSLAELLVEIQQNKFNGSLRLTKDQAKIVVYFDAGDAIFAASNVRQHRLFEILLQSGKISKEQLIAIPNFTNDLVLKENLFKNNLFGINEIKNYFSQQILLIFKTALEWRTGEWQFSPLVRLKGDIRFEINSRNLLMEYGRSLPLSDSTLKFNDKVELFRAKPILPADVILSPHESFVFSRFEDNNLTIEKIQNLSGLSETETQRIVYTLWVGGLLIRENWSAAFSEKKKAAILTARLALKKTAQSFSPAAELSQTNAEETPRNEEINQSIEESEAQSENELTAEIKPAEALISLEDFIKQVESASSFYEVFNVPPEASASEIKQKYFALAKRFHPDLYHREADSALLQKIQSAFTKLAQAYETLKTESTREVYDFRMRKEIADSKTRLESELSPEEAEEQLQSDQASENFDRGFNFLMDGEYEEAVPFMARAVYFDADNARYHAYYGKALSTDNSQRYKAESEFQTAIRIDPHNDDYRIMLAEFFIEYNLLKRAEGELKRLLAISPENREAQRILDRLLKK